MSEGIQWRPQTPGEYFITVAFFGAGLVGLGIALGCSISIDLFKRIRGKEHEY